MNGWSVGNRSKYFSEFMHACKLLWKGVLSTELFHLTTIDEVRVAHLGLGRVGIIIGRKLLERK